MFDPMNNQQILVSGKSMHFDQAFQLNFHPDISEQTNAHTIPMKIIENTSIPIQPQSGRTQRRHLATLLLIFLLSIIGLCTMYILFPRIDPYVTNDWLIENSFSLIF